MGASVLAYAAAMGSAAALPYPDPTPALLAHQEADLAQIWTLAAFGAGLLAVGAVWQAVRWCWRRSVGNC